LNWAKLLKPKDDSGSDHFGSLALPNLAVASTKSRVIRLSTLGSLGILYAYPLTAALGMILPDW
jgi:hypothetical protein